MITLDEVKAHLRIEHDDDNSRLEGLILAALMNLEHMTGRALLDRIETLVLDVFDPVIKLPFTPVQAVASVEYLDANGVLQTLSNFRLDTRTSPARLMPIMGQCWPATANEPQSITITARVGYPTLPADLKHAALMLIGHLNEHAEAVSSVSLSEVPLGLKYLLQAYTLVRM